MSEKNAFYAQSGGCTAVINTTASAVITTARQHNDKINRVFAGKNGIMGALQEELYDTSIETDKNIELLKYTPGCAFGSCRVKLKNVDEHPEHFERLFNVFKAHNICYFFYNGGNDSADTIFKISQACEKFNYPMQCIGIPKTIDNDIAMTDNCPGFASAAKFIATTIRECSLDLQSMCASSTKVFVYEVMGRHSGWLAAASGLASQNESEGPHIILLPETTFDRNRFLARVDACVKKHGHCVIAASEGIRDANEKFLTDHGYQDNFGHTQLGGVASLLAHMIYEKWQYKYHWAVADYMQRASSHLASQTDHDQAYAVGKKAVELALTGEHAVMPIIHRDQQSPYEWSIRTANLDQIANVEKKLPVNFISENQLHITQACRDYLAPLIQGEVSAPYKNGLPVYAKLQKILVKKRLNAYNSLSN